MSIGSAEINLKNLDIPSLSQFLFSSSNDQIQQNPIGKKKTVSQIEDLEVEEVSSGFVPKLTNFETSVPPRQQSLERVAMSAEQHTEDSSYSNPFGLPHMLPSTESGNWSTSSDPSEFFSINRGGNQAIPKNAFQLPNEERNAQNPELQKHEKRIDRNESNPAISIQEKERNNLHRTDTNENPEPHLFHPVHSVHFSSPLSAIAELPSGARLFLGNLASERTDRHEIASIFAKYGNICEISLKASFGFVQFDNPRSCHEAINGEKGRNVGGLNLDLKVSRDKPTQKQWEESMEKKKNDNRDFRRKRDDREGGNRKTDRYTPSDRNERFSGKPYENRRDDNGNFRGKGRGRGARFDRDRDQSPPLQRGNLKGSRWSGENHEQNNEYPLPRRYGSQVPDCQIIIRGEVDRRFIAHVEMSITAV
ncbi:hypothetical protein HK096_005057, partial [Nowakowskiella sp. JEL0078]